MALIEKKPGAPAGTLKVSISYGTYIFVDGVPLDVLDQAAYKELSVHPYLRPTGTGGVYTPQRFPTVVSVAASEIADDDEGKVPVRTNGTFELQTVSGVGGSTDPEVVRDTIAAALVGGANITITPNDASNTITISASGGTTDQEVVRDTIASALVAGSNVTITPNDAGDTITISATGGGTTDPEVVRDTIASALVAGTNVTITPNDAGNTITIAASGGGGSSNVVVTLPGETAPGLSYPSGALWVEVTE